MVQYMYMSAVHAIHFENGRREWMTGKGIDAD